MSISAQIESVVGNYVELTPATRTAYERAKAVVPAGATRSLNSWEPHPLYLTRGAGSRVWDVDGREYVDFLNNYTALVLGHAHPKVVAAIADQAQSGTSFSFSTTLEAELAEVLVDRIPSVERIRFMGSGTEAAMFSLRLARAATGRRKTAKMEGGFHGTYDAVAISVRPPSEAAGPIARPIAVAETEGLADGVADNVVVLPFNHVEETLSLIDEHADDLAAVITEPVLGVGGMIRPKPGYLEAVREACDRHGIVLVFDEVISLCLAPGGAQELFGVMPDLTVMGKIIGGGLPIGAVGGNAELMALFEPRGGHDVYDRRTGGPPVYQGGTFTGNPLSLRAGLVTLAELTPEAYARLGTLGDMLRRLLSSYLSEFDVPAAVTGIGSLFNVFAAEEPIETARDTQRVDPDRQHELFLGLLNNGFVIAPRGMGCISTAMDEDDVHRFAYTAAKVLLRLIVLK